MPHLASSDLATSAANPLPVARWKLSHYSAIFDGEQGELLICNSFMGAMSKIPPAHRDRVVRAAREGLAEADRLAAPFDMLCANGYFIDADVEEVPLVTQLLERERGQSGQELILMPHENCNFRCVYCYETFAKGMMKPELVEGLKALVETRAAEWGRVHISWFGGEPLLARKVLFDLSDSFIATCKRLGIRYSSAMTTNGFYLTPDVADRLLQCEVRFFQITVDGPEHEHNKRRHLVKGGPSYRQVLDNLVALHERDDEFTVRLRVNFDPDSYGSLDGWMAEIAPLFAGDKRFELAFHPIGRWGGPNDEKLNVCGEDASWKNRLHLVESSIESGFSTETYRGFLAAHGSTCYAGRQGSMVIGSDGTVYKCTVVFDDPRNQVGKLAPDGTLTIDQAKWDKWVSVDDLETKKCGSCWFNAACQSRACPLVAMDKQEPPCPTHAEEMQGIVELAAYGRRVRRSLAFSPKPPSPEPALV